MEMDKPTAATGTILGKDVIRDVQRLCSRLIGVAQKHGMDKGSAAEMLESFAALAKQAEFLRDLLDLAGQAVGADGAPAPGVAHDGPCCDCVEIVREALVAGGWTPAPAAEEPDTGGHAAFHEDPSGRMPGSSSVSVAGGAHVPGSGSGGDAVIGQGADAKETRVTIAHGGGAQALVASEEHPFDWRITGHDADGADLEGARKKGKREP